MSSPSKHSNLGQARSQARSRSLSPFEEEPPARGLTANNPGFFLTWPEIHFCNSQFLIVKLSNQKKLLTSSNVNHLYPNVSNCIWETSHQSLCQLKWNKFRIWDMEQQQSNTILCHLTSKTSSLVVQTFSEELVLNPLLPICSPSAFCASHWICMVHF